MVRSKVSLQGSFMRVLLCLFFAFTALSARAAELRSLQLLGGPDGVRAVFELSASSPINNVFTLANPDRLVVDLDGFRVKPSLKQVKLTQGIVKDVRYGRHGKALRVVFDLNRPVRSDHFNMAPGGGYGHRLIVDLNPQGSASPATVTAAVNPARRAAAVAAPPVPAVRLRKKVFVVAIDPGHGGKDPGAHGPHGLDEKTVTLAVAKKLAVLVDKQPGMKAVLTRTGNYYVGLRERMVIARKAKADLFISIHCNSMPHRNPDVRGTEVYVLSQHGATSVQARWVANRENAADMVGGVDIKGKSSQLASVLVDISQSATLDASFDLARRLMTAMGKINPLLHSVVQEAAFVVLKSPDIPSALVETGFITNPYEARRLASASYQEKIAHSLLRGIHGYYTQYRPQQKVPVLQTAQNGKLQPVSLRDDD